MFISKSWCLVSHSIRGRCSAVQMQQPSSTLENVLVSLTDTYRHTRLKSVHINTILTVHTILDHYDFCCLVMMWCIRYLYVRVWTNGRVVYPVIRISKSLLKSLKFWSLSIRYNVRCVWMNGRFMFPSQEIQNRFSNLLSFDHWRHSRMMACLFYVACLAKYFFVQSSSVFVGLDSHVHLIVLSDGCSRVWLFCTRPF